MVGQNMKEPTRYYQPLPVIFGTRPTTRRSLPQKFQLSMLLLSDDIE